MKSSYSVSLSRAQPWSHFSMWPDPAAAPPMYGQSSNSAQGSSTGTRSASGKAPDLLISWNSNFDHAFDKMHGMLVEVQQVFLPLFRPGIGYRWACNHILYLYFLWKQSTIVGLETLSQAYRECGTNEYWVCFYWQGSLFWGFPLHCMLHMPSSRKCVNVIFVF